MSLDDFSKNIIERGITGTISYNIKYKTRLTPWDNFGVQPKSCMSRFIREIKMVEVTLYIESNCYRTICTQNVPFNFCLKFVHFLRSLSLFMGH